MTDLAERPTRTGLAEETGSASAPGGTPPEHLPPVGTLPATPWPSRAKLLIAALAVAALLGAAGTVIGFTSDGDPTATEQEMESTIANLTAGRDELVLERDGLLDQVAMRDRTIEAGSGQRLGLIGQIADLESMVDMVASDREGLVDQVVDLEMTIDALALERDGFRDDLATETRRATAAEAERDVLAELFPITFDASLENVTVDDLAGTYDAAFTEAFCNGFDTCGTKLSVDELELKETSEGYLQVVIDDIATASLYRVDGALYGVADATPTVAACGTTPRAARIAVTVFAQGISVADDGTHDVTDFGASLTIRSAASGSCDAGLAIFGSALTPAG